MRTLARKGGVQHGNRPQLSARSGAGSHFLSRILLWAVTVLLGSETYAADPQSYKVELASTGNGEMNATLKATSDLISLRTSAPVGPFGLIGRARSDLERLKTVLESYGYYQSYVAITIDGLALDDPTLGDELTSKAKGDDAKVKATFTIGPLYHLRRVDIDGDLPESAQGALALPTGAPAVAAQVLAAGDRLQTALEDEGYAFAKVDTPVAHEDPPNKVLDVSFHVVTGTRVNIGAISFRGLKRMHEAFVRNRLLLHKGEQYGASKVEKARKDLLALGVFTSVTVQLGTKADSAGEVPITFRVRERPLHVVNLSGAYSTDLGASTGVTWTNRNMTGRADSLALSASVINLGGSASNGIGYDLGAKYLLPEFGHRDQSLQLAVQAIHQSLQAYDQKALTFGATLSRKFSPEWTATVGLTAEVERIGQEAYYYKDCATAKECETGLDANNDVPISPVICTPGVGCVADPAPTATGYTEEYFTANRLNTNYTLVGIPLTLLYNSTGQDSPLEDATHGWRASFSETPTLSFGRPETPPAGIRPLASPAARNAKFFITQGSVAYYFDLNKLGFNADPGRSILALRALAGLAQGAGQYSLPPDQRFYAGGSGTVRGYRFQSVGPLFYDGNPIGGTALNAGQAEFRQRIGPSLGFAVFMDAGQVSQDVNPLDSTLRFGAGAGVRYYTPIGPLRVDFGIPVNRPHERSRVTGQTTAVGDAFELYIGLGQSF